MTKKPAVITHVDLGSGRVWYETMVELDEGAIKLGYTKPGPKEGKAAQRAGRTKEAVKQAHYRERKRKNKNRNELISSLCGAEIAGN